MRTILILKNLEKGPLDKRGLKENRTIIIWENVKSLFETSIRKIYNCHKYVKCVQLIDRNKEEMVAKDIKLHPQQFCNCIYTT